MNKTQRLMGLREGGWTERMHTVPHHGSYSVASHSHQMAIIILALCPNPSTELLKACLFHDLPERWVGDTPYGAKYQINPELGKELSIAEAIISDELDIGVVLTPLERKWLRFADMFEFHLWCQEQVHMGNRLVMTKLKESWEALMKMRKDDLIPESVGQFLLEFRWHLSENTKWLHEVHNVS